MWKCFNDLFSYFILTALIDDEVFAVHGGLSPSIQSIDQIRDLDRTADVGSISFLWIVLFPSLPRRTDDRSSLV